MTPVLGAVAVGGLLGVAVAVAVALFGSAEGFEKRLQPL